MSPVRSHDGRRRRDRGDWLEEALDERTCTDKHLSWLDHRLVEDSQQLGDIVVAIDRQDGWVGAAELAEAP